MASCSPTKVRVGLSSLPVSTGKRRSLQVPSGKDGLRGSQAAVMAKSVRPTDRLTAQDCKREIQYHISQRINSFLLQLIVCYQTPDLQFFIGDTLDQFGRGKTTGMKTATCGAHIGTLPTLYVQSRKELADHARDPSNHPQPKIYVYLRGSHYHTTQNITSIVPPFINYADSKLDGKKNSSKLRQISIDLINRTALGTLTPEKALLHFIDSLEATIENAIKVNKTAKSIKKHRAPVSDENEAPRSNGATSGEDLNNRNETLETLKIYAKEAHKIGMHLRKDPQIFDYLLGMKTNNDYDLRQSLLPKVYEKIKQSQIIEARIAYLINRGKVEISEIKKERAIKFLIAHSDCDTSTILKLFCKPSSFAGAKQKLTPKEKAKLIEMASRIKIELQLLNELEASLTNESVKGIKQAPVSDENEAPRANRSNSDEMQI